MGDFRTWHTDLCSWHDIYEWYQSYRMPSGVELQLQRDLCEAMRLGNMAEAKRLRKEITGLDAGGEVARLQNRLDAAVRLEDYEQAARLRDDLFLAQLSRQAARRIEKLEERVFWEIQDLKALILQNQGCANSPTQKRTSSLPPQSLPQSAPRVIAHTRSGKSS